MWFALLALLAGLGIGALVRRMSGFTQDNVSSPYSTFKSITRYIYKTGVQVLPIASPAGFNGKPCAILQIHAPNGAKVFEFVTERDGQPPVLPDTKPPDDNHVLSSVELAFFSPDRKADGETQKFKVEGVYAYALRKPLTIENGQLTGPMYFGGTPFDAEPPEPVSPGSLDTSSGAPRLQG